MVWAMNDLNIRYVIYEHETKYPKTIQNISIFYEMIVYVFGLTGSFDIVIPDVIDTVNHELTRLRGAPMYFTNNMAATSLTATIANF